MKKYFLVFFTFVCCFFLSSRVFASEFVRLSLEDSYIELVSNDTPLSFVSASDGKLKLTNAYRYDNINQPLIDAIYIELNNSGGFLAHKEYQFSLVFNPNTSISGLTSDLFPYLVYLPNNYSLDTNLLFNSKNVKFCQDSECTSYFTRDQMNLSYFSMGYSDNELAYIYTINFTWVSPYPIDHIEFRLLTNTSLVNNNNNYVWKFKNVQNYGRLDLSKSLLVYDYYDFQGVPNDNVCVGDECINHYDPDDSISSNPNINSNVNIQSIISNAWSGLSSFASASIYIISMITTLFNSLPLEVKSLLLFCFSLGVIVILWKVLKI